MTKEIKIPESISVKLFVQVDVKPDGYQFGQIRIDCFDMEALYPDGDDFHKYIKIHEVEINVPIPPMEIDITKQAVIYLEEQRRKELAEHHMKLKKIDEQLMELRTLEYHP